MFEVVPKTTMQTRNSEVATTYKDTGISPHAMSTHSLQLVHVHSDCRNYAAQAACMHDHRITLLAIASTPELAPKCSSADLLERLQIRAPLCILH